MKRPHPLLWLCFALSMLALVLEVPKGSLPTITGRHKALRVGRSCLAYAMLSDVAFYRPGRKSLKRSYTS